MKALKILVVLYLLSSCKADVKTEVVSFNSEDEKAKINANLNLWHKAAANANFDDYFGLMTTDGIFIGTDATENWQNEEFRAFSKPYFVKGKAWSFSTLERNIYINENGKLAWFDELLDTQMGICRGSGVMQIEDKNWKVKHYVLSIAIPNNNVKEVVKLKTEFDSVLIEKLRKN